jgi:23S rRNA (pseudouridine1915-N3)-methyltransferase
VGRDRSGWFEPAVQGYAERIRRHAELDILELPAAKGALPAADARRREADALNAKLKPESWLVALDEHGALLDSVELARLVATARDAGRELVFCIGGDEGLDDSVRDEAWKVLSLSRMTLPHRLARLVLLEQLYRALSILRGEPYHK